MTWLDEAIADGAHHVFRYAEASGTVLQEDINNRDGSIEGATRTAAFTDGGEGGYSCDGDNDRLTLGTVQEWCDAVTTSKQFTIVRLFRTTEPGSGYILSAQNGTGSQFIEMALNREAGDAVAADSIMLGYRSHDDSTSRRSSFVEADVFDGQPHFLAFMADLNTSVITAYLDGVLIDTFDVETGVGSAGEVWSRWEAAALPSVGCRNRNGALDRFGQIEDGAAAFFSTILSPTRLGAQRQALLTDPVPPPTADAGSNSTVANGGTRQLNGTGSTPGTPGNTLTYAWTITSGPGSLTNATTATPTFHAAGGAGGDATEISLVVTEVETGVASAADTVTVTELAPAPNSAPTAVASVGQDEAIEGQRVAVSAVGSSDPDDDPITYAWSQVSGPTVTFDDAAAEETFFIAPRPATGEAVEEVVVQVEVSDGTLTDTAEAPGVLVTHAVHYRHDGGVLIPVLSYAGVNT